MNVVFLFQIGAIECSYQLPVISYQLGIAEVF